MQIESKLSYNNDAKTDLKQYHLLHEALITLITRFSLSVNINEFTRNVSFYETFFIDFKNDNFVLKLASTLRLNCCNNSEVM